MSETPIHPSIVTRWRSLDALKIVGMSLLIGPPIGGVVAGFAMMAQNAIPNSFSDWRDVAFIPIDIWLALLHGLILALPAAFASYFLGTGAAAASALAFVVADRVAPAHWPRTRLGIVCGLVVSSLRFSSDFFREPFAEFASAEFILCLSGAVSGGVCALSCQRAGWTR